MEKQFIAPWATLSDDGKTVLYKAVYKNLTVVYNTKHRTVIVYGDDKEPLVPHITLHDYWNHRHGFVYTVPDTQPTQFLRVEIYEHTHINNTHAQGPIFAISELNEPSL